MDDQSGDAQQSSIYLMDKPYVVVESCQPLFKSLRSFINQLRAIIRIKTDPTTITITKKQ
jgi:hypothetical protein